MSKVIIYYDAKCKHCRNFQQNGRGRKTTCKLKHEMMFGGKTKACDDFKL